MSEPAPSKRNGSFRKMGMVTPNQSKSRAIRPPSHYRQRRVAGYAQAQSRCDIYPTAALDRRRTETEIVQQKSSSPERVIEQLVRKIHATTPLSRIRASARRLRMRSW